MADTKITALTAIGANPINVATFPIPMVDLLDNSMAASGTTKKVTVNQILGAGGTATLASATITGDLTVDTNTLKVDSANNRVGVNTATPSYDLDVNGVANFKDAVVHRIGGQPMFARVGAANSFLYAGTTALTVRNNADTSDLMTLNSTGLGVGASPSQKLHLYSNTTPAAIRLQSASPYAYPGDFTVGAGGFGTPSFYIYDNTNSAFRFVLDTSGNVGIGVTPSAWNSTYRSIDIGSIGSIAGRTGASNTVDVTSNGFRDGSGNWIYKISSSVSRYTLDGSTGSHFWYTAPSGTAGNTITFTQAMTLDASGNLLVGKSVSLFSTVGVEASGTGFISATNSASTNASTNLSVYSTGAAAFRFYVGLGGTVYATNTTISAISDQRLKENVQDIDVGLGAILALKPRKFDWKAGKGKDIKGDRGFIAQEFEQVFPQLVDEWKDAAPEGEAPYKSVRQDLIPVLVKAIQELAAEVNALKNA